MALTAAQVRQRLAAVVQALSGWSETDLLPDQVVPQHTAAVTHPFQIEAARMARYEGELAAASGALVESEMTVRWLRYRIPHDYPATLDAVLTAEEALVHAVLAISKADLAVHWLDSERTLNGQWMEIRTRFLFTHALAFA